MTDPRQRYLVDTRMVIEEAMESEEFLDCPPSQEPNVIARALAAAGMLVTPEHDAAVRKAALEEAATECEMEIDELRQLREPALAGQALACRDRIRALTAAAALMTGAWHGPAPVQPGWAVAPLHVGRMLWI